MLVFKNTKLKIMNPRIGPPQYHIGRSAYRAESYLDTTIVIAGIGWCRSESFWTQRPKAHTVCLSK